MASSNHVSRKRNIDGELVASSSTESASEMDKPICFIENTTDNKGAKLVVNPEAIKILSNIPQPAVVVSIVGMYRTGKSYLMNRLAGARKGFSLGSTIRSETKGIWMWCIPHPTLKDHVLVLLDTEGLGDVEKGDTKNDSKIFALAVLLSSALVYNSSGTINQDALNKLKHVGEITELIKVKTGNTQNEEAKYSTYFPIFIWTVRDLTLDLVLDGETITEDEYLENSLKLKAPERSEEDKNFNDLRNRVRTYFGTRRCFVFERPVDSNRDLKELEHLPDERLVKSFLAQTKIFCDYIFTNAKVKAVDITIDVTGRRLGELASLYTEALNSSQVACLEEAVISLAEKENKIAVQEATTFYEDKMRTIELPTETLDQFLDVNRGFEEEARKIFLQRAIKDTDEKFLQEFSVNVKRIRMEFSGVNEEKSREKCEALLKELTENFEKDLAKRQFHKIRGHGRFQMALNTIKEKYNKAGGKGVKAEEVLQEYMAAKQADEIAIIQKDNALSQKQKKKEAENARKQVEEMKKEIQEREEAQKKQKVEEELASQRRTIEQLQKMREEERRRMDEKLEQVIREKEREQQLLMAQQSQRQLELMQQQIIDLQREKENGGLFTVLGNTADYITSFKWLNRRK